VLALITRHYCKRCDEALPLFISEAFSPDATLSIAVRTIRCRLLILGAAPAVADVRPMIRLLLRFVEHLCPMPPAPSCRYPDTATIDRRCLPLPMP